MARHTEIEALRQVAFPDFPFYRIACEERATDARDDVEWNCDRHVGHEGPHMGTYEYDGEGTIIGYAWTDNDAEEV